MISSPGTEVGPGPRKPKMPSQTSHITGLVGDHEKLNFQQNIVENFVGVELEELSDEDEKKPAEVVQKDNHKSSNVDVAQSNNPEHPGESANTTGRPAGVANQDVEIVNQEGNNPQEPNSNIEPLEPENNSPEQLAAEIQANIQEDSRASKEANRFVSYMLTLSSMCTIFTILAVVSGKLCASKWRGCLWACMITSACATLQDGWSLYKLMRSIHTCKLKVLFPELLTLAKDLLLLLAAVLQS